MFRDLMFGVYKMNEIEILRAEIAGQKATIKRLTEYLEMLLEDQHGRCYLDHHGSCQAHGWPGVGGEWCPIAEARAYLAEHAAKGEA